MDKSSAPNVNKIVLPAPQLAVQPPPLRYVAEPFPRLTLQQWAPAWFYSALNWLGKSYYDASNVQQSFNLYMVGSDVRSLYVLGRHVCS